MHELSEGDTRYLGACTKGGSAKSILQPQYYNKDTPAKRRAFSFKQGYMTHLINHYALKGTTTYDSAFSVQNIKSKNFDDEIIGRINKYKGKSEEELYKLFKIEGETKQRNNNLICRMLGVKTDRVAEFEKADIKIKTIRIKSNGESKESMSFPSIVMKEFAKESFDDSVLYKYFSEKRFLFVVFEESDEGKYILSKSKFWNMPIVDLENKGQEDWTKIQNKIINGVKFTLKHQKDKVVIQNDLPKPSETNIFHLRPHARRGAYLIDGKHYGKGSDSDMDELPNGDKMTKQCFWLNSRYVQQIVTSM